MTEKYSVNKIITDIWGMNESLPFETTTKKFPKGFVIVDKEAYFENNYLLVSGIIQFNTISKEKEEKIIEFIFPGEFFGIYSFYQPGRFIKDFYVTCLTECTLEVMPLQEYKKASEHSLLVNKLSRYVLEYWFIKRLQKEKDMLIKTAEQRYFDLIENRSEIVKKIPITKIAKYLGVHPDSLSRIRRRVQKTEA